jgi:serine protease Do
MSSSQLPVLVANTAPGTAARLDVMRKGETRHIDVTVGELRNAKVAAADVAGQNHGRLGVVVRALNPDEQKQAGVTGGLVVENATGAPLQMRAFSRATRSWLSTVHPSRASNS